MMKNDHKMVLIFVRLYKQQNKYKQKGEFEITAWFWFI